mgnify:CR=1 FL=1
MSFWSSVSTLEMLQQLLILIGYRVPLIVLFYSTLADVRQFAQHGLQFAIGKVIHEPGHVIY